MEFFESLRHANERMTEFIVLGSWLNGDDVIAFRDALHLMDKLFSVFDNFVKGFLQFADFVFTVDSKRLGQISFGNLMSDAGGFFERFNNDGGRQKRYEKFEKNQRDDECDDKSGNIFVNFFLESIP